jgi:hypothetical protein
MEDAGGSPVQPLDVRPANVREPKSPAGVGNADLSGMKVAGKDEVEDARPKPVDHLREVAEKDSQVGVRVREALRSRESRPIGARIDADDLHTSTSKLDRLGLVRQNPRRAEVAQLHRLRERVPRDREIVVAEDREAARKPRQELAQHRLAPPAGDEVAADQRQVRLPLLDPLDRSLDRVGSTRRGPEVEVRQMGDAKPVQLRRQPRKPDVGRLQPHPPRLEPAVRRQPGPDGGSSRDDWSDQTWSLSSTGVTGTT